MIDQVRAKVEEWHQTSVKQLKSFSYAFVISDRHDEPLSAQREAEASYRFCVTLWFKPVNQPQAGHILVVRGVVCYQCQVMHKGH